MARSGARGLWTDRVSVPAIHNAGRTKWREAIGFCLLSPMFGEQATWPVGLQDFRHGPYSRLTSRRLARVSPSI